MESCRIDVSVGIGWLSGKFLLILWERVGNRETLRQGIETIYSCLFITAVSVGRSPLFKVELVSMTHPF
jgi:hypothetical protein